MTASLKYDLQYYNNILNSSIEEIENAKRKILFSVQANGTDKDLTHLPNFGSTDRRK